MSSESSRSGSGSGRNRRRRPRATTREEQELEEEFTSPPPSTMYDTSLSFLLPNTDPLPPDPDPPVPQAAPPRLVEGTLSFASAVKKPGAPPVTPSSAPVTKKPGAPPVTPSSAPVTKKPAASAPVPKKPAASAPVPKKPAAASPATPCADVHKKPAAAVPDKSRSTPAPVPDKARPASAAVPGIGHGAPPIAQPQSDPLQSLKDDFIHLLKNKGKQGDGKSYYERRALVMSNLTKSGEDTYVLDVDFDHLLNDNRYFQVAVQCSKDLQTKNNWHGWLQPTARDFLNTQFELAENEKIRLEFRFIHEPISVKPISEYPTSKLVKQAGTFCDEYDQRDTTYTGRRVYIAVVHEVLHKHSEGYTCDGKFNSGNIYIIRYEGGIYTCRIVSDRMKRITDLSERVADFQRVDVVVTPKYELNGMSPAYFAALREDLSSLSVKTLSDSGILQYLPFHLAFMTPKARRYLLWEIFLFSQSPDLNSDVSKDEFDAIFMRVFKSDWRSPFSTSTDPVLQGVWNHESKDAKGKKAKGVKGDETVRGCLTYKKNVVQHAFEHLCGFGDDSELYAAWKIPQVLPHIIRSLFRGKKMKLMKQLGSIWDHYCRMRDVRDEAP